MPRTTCCRSSPRPRASIHEHCPHRFERLDAAPRTEHDTLEWRIDEMHGHARFATDARRQAAQHAATTDELNAFDEKILRQFGRRLRETSEHRVDHRRDDLV